LLYHIRALHIGLLGLLRGYHHLTTHPWPGHGQM
jgi:hypothetical protein